MSRLMRILVMFDLPVKTKAERRSATQFRNFLVNDGYHMVQYSVYLCPRLQRQGLRGDAQKQDIAGAALQRLGKNVSDHGKAVRRDRTARRKADALR